MSHLSEFGSSLYFFHSPMRHQVIKHLTWKTKSHMNNIPNITDVPRNIMLSIKSFCIMLQLCRDTHYTNIHHIVNTHTHVGFYGLRGLSIDVMVFILYKLYVLLPYTCPTPKLSPHRRRCISTFPQKNLLCMIYKHFELWGHWKCPHKSPSPCNTYVIPMSLYKFVSS